LTPFSLSATIVATYIFTAPTCTTTITTLQPRADLIKFPYIADLSQRGDMGEWRQREDWVTLRKNLILFK
jgi:hypothetical protein